MKGPIYSVSFMQNSKTTE